MPSFWQVSPRVQSTADFLKRQKQRREQAARERALMLETLKVVDSMVGGRVSPDQEEHIILTVLERVDQD